MPIKMLTRPASNAESNLRFGVAVTTALEGLGVAPGEDFAIATPESVRARARRGDPETSKQAARSVADLRGSQADVLKVFRDYGHGQGFTDEELLRAYRRGMKAGIVRQQSDSGIRSRRAEIAEAGFVVDSTRRARTRAGREAVVWTLAEHVDPTPALSLVPDDRLFSVEGIRLP